MEEVLEDNYKYWIILNNIYCLKINSEITRAQLARLIKIQPTHPYFCNIIKYLIIKQIIDDKDNYGLPFSYVTIDNKKLGSLLKNAKPISEFIDFAKIYNPFGWNL